jgi:hypothetical protein
LLLLLLLLLPAAAAAAHRPVPAHHPRARQQSFETPAEGSKHQPGATTAVQGLRVAMPYSVTTKDRQTYKRKNRRNRRSTPLQQSKAESPSTNPYTGTE